MDLRNVRDDMKRVKIHFLKGETLLALEYAVKALTELGSASAPMDVRGFIREGLQLLSRDDGVKALLKEPLLYTPGKEKELYETLSEIYKQMTAEAGREDKAEALARKKKLDQCLIFGQKLLVQGKISEADASFQEALKYYKNESRIFQIIGKYLVEAGQGKRAMSYLRKAMEIEPGNTVAGELVQKAAALTQKAATPSKD